jgi:hypothetical protein
MPAITFLFELSTGSMLFAFVFGFLMDSIQMICLNILIISLFKKKHFSRSNIKINSVYQAGWGWGILTGSAR